MYKQKFIKQKQLKSSNTFNYTSYFSGDHVYKQTVELPPEEQMISPLPDIQTLDLEPDIEFMVLACDGIWNSMSSKEVVDFVRSKLLKKCFTLSQICEKVFFEFFILFC